MASFSRWYVRLLKLSQWPYDTILVLFILQTWDTFLSLRLLQYS